MAARMMAKEAPGHTLDTSGLVHEAYIRLFQGVRSVFRQLCLKRGCRPRAK